MKNLDDNLIRMNSVRALVYLLYQLDIVGRGQFQSIVYTECFDFMDRMSFKDE